MDLAKYTVFGTFALGLLGCAEPEYILPGERETLHEYQENARVIEGDYQDPSAAQAATDTASPLKSTPIKLARAKNHQSWRHHGGSITHHASPSTLSTTPALLWSAKIGEGNDKSHRITTEPMIANGQIFTLDSRALVSAISTKGQRIWQRDLTPKFENKDDASGGGLALDNKHVYVSSGFGVVSALNQKTGTIVWQQQLNAPAAGAPLVSDGTVYVMGRDDTATAIAAKNGQVKWTLRGVPAENGVVGGTSAAMMQERVLLPFASGELQAVFKKSGLKNWSSLISGTRSGRAYTQVNEITASPVISNNRIYVGSSSGRVVALDQTGSRIWTAREGALDTVSVSGGSVFLISDEKQLVRLNANTGDRIWAADLPYFTDSRIKKRKEVHVHFGPIIAGGQIIVASSDGWLRFFDPKSGEELRKIDIKGGAASRPVVVDNSLYLVSRNGEVLAFR